MLTRLASFGLALVAATGLATAAPVAFAPDASGAITFVMPSGNVAWHLHAGRRLVGLHAGRRRAGAVVRPPPSRRTSASPLPRAARPASSATSATPAAAAGRIRSRMGRRGTCRRSRAPRRPADWCASAAGMGSRFRRIRSRRISFAVIAWRCRWGGETPLPKTAKRFWPSRKGRAQAEFVEARCSHTTNHPLAGGSKRRRRFGEGCASSPGSVSPASPSPLHSPWRNPSCRNASPSAPPSPCPCPWRSSRRLP